jgi:hypothetical protein
MSSLRFVVVLSFVALTTATAFAQGTPQQRSACRSDVARFCKGMDDTGAIHGCLQSHYAKLRPACQKVLSGG